MAWNSLSQIEKGSKLVDLLKLPANWKKIYQDQLRLPSKSIYQGSCLCCFVKTWTVNGSIPPRSGVTTTCPRPSVSWVERSKKAFRFEKPSAGEVEFFKARKNPKPSDFKWKQNRTLCFECFLEVLSSHRPQYMFTSCSYSVLVHYFTLLFQTNEVMRPCSESWNVWEFVGRSPKQRMLTEAKGMCPKASKNSH